MSYKSMNTHSETFEVDGKYFKVIANFLQNKLWIENNGIKTEFSLDEYIDFEGNMNKFVESKLTLDIPGIVCYNLV